MSNTTTETAPRIFLTDYASYNNGTQFEFGHWVDLDQFSDADELGEYIREHFEEADKKSPLGYGSIREETMITDYEGFPEDFYSESSMNFDDLYLWINAEDHKKAAAQYLMEDGQYSTFEECLDHAEDVTMHHDDGRNSIVQLFSDYFPDADKADDDCNYITIDYDRFKEDYFNEFEFDGQSYLVDRE